ncbi:MAG: FumA C-terminus/TtdB family hydratase beta subunit [Spirochaetota bacterium]
MKSIYTPLAKETIAQLKAGEEIELNGTVYVARDQAHRRMAEQYQQTETFPFPLSGRVIYYMGPAPTPPGAVIGSCGPTTASRMDPFTPLLLKNGLKGMIGKGPRSPEVVSAIVKYGAIYFYAYGGCGALYAGRIAENTLVAFADLGPEAVYRLKLKNFPVTVAIDSSGKNMFAPRD